MQGLVEAMILKVQVIVQFASPMKLRNLQSHLLCLVTSKLSLGNIFVSLTKSSTPSTDIIDTVPDGKAGGGDEWSEGRKAAVD